MPPRYILSTTLDPEQYKLLDSFKGRNTSDKMRRAIHWADLYLRAEQEAQAKGEQIRHAAKQHYKQQELKEIIDMAKPQQWDGIIDYINLKKQELQKLA